MHFGLRRGDGLALLRWLLDLVGDPETEQWMKEAAAHVERESNVTASDGQAEMAAEQRYKTPAAFRRALTDRLKAKAANSQWSLEQLQRQMAL